MVKQEMEIFRQEFQKEFDKILQFNGYYQRNMLSTLGRINEIDIPRFRENPNDLSLNSLNVFDSERDNFIKLIQNMHLLGISTRKINKLCQLCFGTRFSKNKVSKVYQELAKKEEVNINSQLLSDDFEYLLLDGLWEKTKNFGFKENNKSVLLCALGIKKNRERKIIGFKLAWHEDYENWHNLLLNLKQRGLLGKNLKLVISDDNFAIIKAVNHLYPEKKIQICIAHKMRNVIAKTSGKNKKVCPKI